jgi:hypothetical protein
MGLPVRQRRVLERIEATLRRSDPKLASLYAIFGRLVQDEEMPGIEQLRHWALRLVAGLRFVPALAGFGHHLRLGPRQRAVLLFPLAIALAIASIVFAARSASGCTPVRTVAAAKYVARSKLCKPPTGVSNLYIGH